MDTDTRRYPVIVTVKISRELDEELRRRAREDDRPVTSVIRRLLIAAALPQTETGSGP
jgi:hypothetical protein